MLLNLSLEYFFKRINSELLYSFEALSSVLDALDLES